MSIRFRRTYKIFPGVKINVSKGGISVTAGVRGAKLNFSKKGVRQTIGLPGSGLSETSYIMKNDHKEHKSEKAKDSDDEKEKSSEDTHEEHESDDQEVGCFPGGCFWLLVILLIGGFIAANAYHLIPPNYFSNMLQVITQWVRNIGF